MAIAHINDLEISKFIDTVRRLANKDKSIEMSIKFDGSANLGFGLDDQGHLYFDRAVKGQSEYKRSPDDWPKKPMYNALRSAVAVLLKNKSVLEKHMKPGDYTDCEVMFETMPNSIEYDGNNYVILHNAEFNYLIGKLKPTKARIDLYNIDMGSNKIKKTEAVVTYKFAGKQVINSKKYKLSINGDIRRLESFLKKKNKRFKGMSNFDVIQMRAAGKDGPKIKAEKESLLAQINEMKLLIKSKLISQILNHTPAGFGATPPEFDDKGNNIGGTFPEGIVIKDLKTGDLSKVVSVFPVINKFLWLYREKAMKGVGKGESYVPGVMTQFADDVAKAFGIKALRSVAVTSNINKKYKGEVANMKLLRFLKDSGFNFRSVGQTRNKYLAAIKTAKRNMAQLKREFESKGVNDVLKVRDNKFKRDIKYGDIVIRKTYETFAMIDDELEDYKRQIQNVKEKTNEGTAVQLLRIFLGQKNLNRLAESVIVEASRSGSVLGVMVGRFQPVQASHVKLIKMALKKSDRMVILVAGQTYDKNKNPIPFSVRKKMLKDAVKSPKLEVYPAKTGFIPAEIENNTDLSNVKKIEVYCGTDRVSGYKTQMKGHWNHDDIKWRVVELKRPPGSISATKVRAAIRAKDEDLFRSYVPRELWGYWSKLQKHVKESVMRRYIRKVINEQEDI